MNVRFPTVCRLLPSLFAAGLLAQTPAGSNAPGPDLKAMDLTADPCADFYQYACGGWLANSSIPPDHSSWGRFDEVEERNIEVLRQILEKAATPASDRDAVSQKLGDYYAACLDVDSINHKGIEPLQPELERIAAIQSKPALLPELVRLQLAGVNVFFLFSSTNDEKNSQRMIATVDQGGFGLPDRDYYFKTDAESVILRRKYGAHMARMFELLGEPAAQAASDSKAVMDIETALAHGALDLLARREPQKIYHKMTVAELVSLCPAIDWPKFFVGLGAPPFDTLDIAEPNFFRTVESVLVESSLDDLKSYLRWQYVHAEARYLPAAFADENFAFFGATLTGVSVQRPRWKSCVEDTDWALGEALGQKFLHESFSAEGREHTLELVRQIEQAMETDLKNVSWMTPATREQALRKLAAVHSKIG